MSSRWNRACGVLAILSGLWLTQIFAGSRELRLDCVTRLGGGVVPPGSYVLMWKDDGNPASVDVTLRSGKRVLASAPGRRVQLERPAAYDGVQYRTDGDGTKSIVRILFAARQEAIEIGS